MDQADFGRVLLLSDRKPEASLDGIEWVGITPLRSRAEYSQYMLRDLRDHILTPHALCVQWDGFVIDGAAWRPEFTDFDYIGAVWPHFGDSFRVGNGGFSLRSRRLLDECGNLPFDGRQAEDVLISRVYRRRLEEAGIRFAPESLAVKFAYERTPSTGDEFGFHGAFNLVRYLSPSEARTVFGSLDPAMLSNSERREVMGWALRRGRFGLASTMFRRLR